MRPPQTDPTLRGPLADIMHERYPDFERELGLKLTHSEYEAKPYGDSLLIYEGPTIRLRLCTERDLVFTEVSRTESPEDWWPLKDVLYLVQNDLGTDGLTLEATVSLLRQTGQELERVLGSEFALCQAKTRERRSSLKTAAWFEHFLNRFRS